MLGVAWLCTTVLMAQEPSRTSWNTLAATQGAVADQPGEQPADRTVAGPSTSAADVGISVRSDQPLDTSLLEEYPLLLGDRGAPPNDDCANAIPLSGTVVGLTFYNREATDDGPVPSCQSNTHKNVWYCWTADRDGRGDVMTIDSGFDTVVTVYDGCDCTNLIEVGCDDDGYYEGTDADLQFDIVAGHSYLISIGGWNTNSGLGLVEITTNPPLPMGACCRDDECIGTMNSEECDGQDGTWYSYGDCAHFVCGECPEDNLMMSIMTDGHPEETSWELVDVATSEVIDAGSGYTAADTSFFYSFCLASDGCYDFTIHDSAGDGLCCDNGEGYYDLILNNLSVGHGNEFGESETVRFGNGCDWPTGACCLAGECIGTMTELECTSQYGTFFIGEDCGSYVCPPSMADCPATTLAGQNLPLIPWQIHLTGSDTTGVGAYYGDSFADVTGTIYGLHWWGVWLNYQTGPCVEPDPTVLIRFYEDAGGQPGSLACEYRTVPTWVPTGMFSSDGSEVLYFSVDLLIPPCTLTKGWVSIQGDGEDPDCRFMWASSDQGDGWSYRISPYPGSSSFDFSYCLDGEYEPRFGACCDDTTGTCQDGAEIAYCTGRFVEGTLCENLDPPCGQPDGACCHDDGTCEVLGEVACTGNWLGAWTTCDDCPCIVSCPEGAVAETEACGSNTNGGCFLNPPTFEPITPGVPVCGTIWADGGTRDTDWYEIVVTEPTAFTWTVEGEFDGLPVLSGFVPTVPLGSPDCSTVNVLDPYAVGAACEPTSITTICLPAGTYWFYVSAADYYGLPCGTNNDYVATLTVEPCALLGACCYNDGYDCVDNLESECDALGGEWWMYESCATHECVVPCPEAAIDIEVFTDWYPFETHWELTDTLTGEVIASEGPYDEFEYLYTERVCVPADRCFTFTIYDSFGNGICCYWGEGYYNVYYNGEPARSGGRFGLEESVDMGPNCPPRAWACCVAGECVGDLTEADCAAQSGTWMEESRCADGYDCTGEVDFRVTAPAIDVSGTSCNTDNDCDLSESDDLEYVVTLPEDGTWAFSLCGSAFEFDTILFVGTTRCGQEVGFNDNFCQADKSLFTATVPAGDYYVTIEGAGGEMCGKYVLNVVKLDECSTECPSGAAPEDEPACYDDYMDATNGGCTGYPVVFSHITCGETVCGTSGTYLNYGDFYGDQDWYQVQLSAPASLKWDVRATFDAQVEIVYSEWGFCEGYYPVASGIGSANVTATAGASVGPGTYWLTVTPAPMWEYGTVACGASYVATLTVDPPDACMCGDMDGDADVDYDDYMIFRSAFGGAVDGDPPQDGVCDYDHSGAVGMADYAAWLQCYRDFIGDPLAGPPRATVQPQKRPQLSNPALQDMELMPQPSTVPQSRSGGQGASPR